MNHKIIIAALLAGLVFSGTPLKAQLPTIQQTGPAKTAVDKDHDDDETDLIDDWQYNPSSRGTKSLGAVHLSRAAGSGRINLGANAKVTTGLQLNLNSTVNLSQVRMHSFPGGG